MGSARPPRATRRTFTDVAWHNAERALYTLTGTAVRSCSVPVSAVGQSKVTTIEGLSEKGDHPVQLAWDEGDVPQCGYWAAGQIMSAAALLA